MVNELVASFHMMGTDRAVLLVLAVTISMAASFYGERHIGQGRAIGGIVFLIVAASGFLF